jgi:hypothetical protein
MDGMKYGYACVSTDDQNPALQLAALKKAGCQTVFKDGDYRELRSSALHAAPVKRSSHFGDFFRRQLNMSRSHERERCNARTQRVSQRATGMTTWRQAWYNAW